MKRHTYITPSATVLSIRIERIMNEPASWVVNDENGNQESWNQVIDGNLPDDMEIEAKHHGLDNTWDD